MATNTLASSRSILYWADLVCDYLPGVSTLTNGIALVAQSIFTYCYYPKTDSATYRNFSFIYKKDEVRCYMALIPVIGNIILALCDLVSTFYEPEMPPLTEQEVSKTLTSYVEGLEKMVQDAEFFLKELTNACAAQNITQISPLYEQFRHDETNPFHNLSNYTQFFVPPNTDPIARRLNNFLLEHKHLDENVIQIVTHVKKLMQIKININNQFMSAKPPINIPGGNRILEKANQNLLTQGNKLPQDWQNQKFEDIMSPVRLICFWIKQK